MTAVGPVRIALIGFMGCGKSTIGPLIARNAGARFVDTDSLLVADAGGRSIPDLFADEGETAFRDRESRILAAVCASKEPLVIATGGGTVLREENVACLRSACFVVWLAARPDVILARTARDKGRPLLAGAQTRAEKHARSLSLLGERGPRYQSTAHLIVDTSDRAPVAIAREIERKHSVRDALSLSPLKAVTQ
ncbi:MAG: shikimate kinase [Cytophagales bacterium]|nr:shikimate kinase [Armatimonadota bacterium]